MCQEWPRPRTANQGDPPEMYRELYKSEEFFAGSYCVPSESGVPHGCEPYISGAKSRYVRQPPYLKRASSSHLADVKIDFTSIHGSMSPPYSPYLQPAVLVDALSKLQTEKFERSARIKSQVPPSQIPSQVSLPSDGLGRPQVVPAHSTVLKAPLTSRPKPDKETTATLVFEDYLYVGPMRAAVNEKFLREEEITDVLSIGVRCSPNITHRVEGITYHEIPALLRLHDKRHSSILADGVIEKAGAIIEEVARSRRIKPLYLRYLPFPLPRKRRKILLHCAKGISRSPSIAIGYLIMFKNLSASEAYMRVQERRPIVRPRSNFLRQLTELDGIVHGFEVLGSL